MADCWARVRSRPTLLTPPAAPPSIVAVSKPTLAPVPAPVPAPSRRGWPPPSSRPPPASAERPAAAAVVHTCHPPPTCHVRPPASSSPMHLRGTPPPPPAKRHGAHQLVAAVGEEGALRTRVRLTLAQRRFSGLRVAALSHARALDATPPSPPLLSRPVHLLDRCLHQYRPTAHPAASPQTGAGAYQARSRWQRTLQRCGRVEHRCRCGATRGLGLRVPTVCSMRRRLRWQRELAPFQLSWQPALFQLAWQQERQRQLEVRPCEAAFCH